MLFSFNKIYQYINHKLESKFYNKSNKNYNNLDIYYEIKDHKKILNRTLSN